MKLGPVLAGGSFPAIRQATGRRPCGFSLFMSLFGLVVVVLFFALSL
nr:MAG TPA: hypothetical protein [Caudoviricetes sp.]